LRLSSSSPAFLLSPPFVPFPFTSCCCGIFAACIEEALPISSESAFLLCRFFVLKCFLFFCGEVKGREREEGIEFRYA
jgi:hypothetical protein